MMLSRIWRWIDEAMWSEYNYLAQKYNKAAANETNQP